MRCASILPTELLAALAAVAAITVAGSAAAQSVPAPGESRSPRYLSWSGRGPVAPVPVALVPVSALPVEAAPGQTAPVIRAARRPNTVIPHGGFATAAAAAPRPGLTPAPGSGRTLTPASAWLQPRPLPPEPAPSPPAVAAPQPPAAASHLLPDYLPAPAGRGQPTPAEAILAPPATAVDPMAPRRDAPIFRMKSSAPLSSAPVEAAVDEAAAAPAPGRMAEVASTGERPPVSNARYYSVHRQNGRRPDALEMPAPTYVDALAVTMVETPASQDLAQPEQGPALIRDAQGRVRPAPAAPDGDHQ